MSLIKDKCAYSEDFIMNTLISNKVYGEYADEALASALTKVKRLENILSRFLPESDISKINCCAGSAGVMVKEETYEVISKSVEYSESSSSGFDITIGPLVKLWSEAKKRRIPPKGKDIINILSLIDYSDIILNEEERRIGLRRSGQSIDLGGIGKGYAADIILQEYKKYKITSAYTNIGGNVALIGAKPDGAPWNIGITHPRKKAALIGVLPVIDKSVVTSGDYQRYFQDWRGKRYHHILDPKTGYPSNSGLISVTVVADNSMLADALSTTIFISGKNKGMEILKSFPGCEAILIEKDLSIYITKDLKGTFQETEGNIVNYF